MGRWWRWPLYDGLLLKKIKDVRERVDNLFGTILKLPRHGNGILRMSSEGSGRGKSVFRPLLRITKILIYISNLHCQ